MVTYNQNGGYNNPFPQQPQHNFGGGSEFAPQMNHYLNKLNDDKDRASHAAVISQVTRAAQKAQTLHPEIPQRVYDDISRQYIAADASFKKSFRKMQQSGPNGVPPDSSWLHMQANMLQEQHSKRIYNSIINKYGDQGATAMRVMRDEMNPGLIHSATKLVYDSDRGGLQVGNILGAIAGFFAGQHLVEKAGAGGWMAIAGIALITGLGGLLGNKISNGISGYVKQRAAEKQHGQGHSKGHSAPDHSKGKGVANHTADTLTEPPQKTMVASNEAQSEHHVDSRDIGQFASPTFPKNTTSTEKII